MDVDYQWIGSQGTLVSAGDLYNVGRMAIYLEGQKFNGAGGYTPGPYLASVLTGTTINDVEQVYVDKKYPLPTQAFDASTNFNVPQVKVGQFRINVNRTFTFCSETASGTTTWQTAAHNLCLDVVSDSAILPNPNFQANIRIWFFFEESM